MMEVAGALASEPGMKQQTYVAAYDMRGREGGAVLAGLMSRTRWAVRRLTPTECERLQGFPDEYTQIPWRGKNGSPDGPRYKALGNSMAVNVMRWLGQRIALVSTLTSSHRAENNEQERQ
jgi:DNA (cytosine-5)-methyltransferase 1